MVINSQGLEWHETRVARLCPLVNRAIRMKIRLRYCLGCEGQHAGRYPSIKQYKGKEFVINISSTFCLWWVFNSELR